MYQRDPRKQQFIAKSPFASQQPNVQTGFQQPQAMAPQQGMVGQFTDMAKQKAMTGALDKGTELAGQGATMAKNAIMSQIAPAAAPAATVGGAPLTGALASSVTPAATGAATGAAAGGMGAGMAALGTAMPYIGAGLLAGKALGFFSQGGYVGPLASATYKSSGGKINNQYQMKFYSPSSSKE